MGDMGDYWRDAAPQMKARSQEKRASNRASSAQQLTERGVIYISKNEGAHLIVRAGDHLVDFWPGTGKWQTRGFRFTVVGRGVRRLLSHLEDFDGLAKQQEQPK